MAGPIEVVPYDPEWPIEFHRLGSKLRAALREVAIRIDHIGSTAIANMKAKPILDIQISVAALEPMTPYKSPLESIGFNWRHDNSDLTKRYFREASGERRFHIHVRKVGSWTEQFSLLFRDYMRMHPADAAAYGGVKEQLAVRHRNHREAYVHAKGPFIWRVMPSATLWAQEIGWEPGPTDM